MATWARQGDLPKLPIPTLEATCATYLETVRPLVSEEEFETTQAAVESFLAKEGPAMQAALIEYDKTVASYVEEFWTDAYVQIRDPLVLNVNPIFVLEDDPTPSRNSQIARAASLILSSMKFVRAIRTGSLQPDYIKKTPLDMSQYANLFGSARVPVFAKNEQGAETKEYVQDKIITFDRSRHIIVMSRSQMYYFDVMWDDGTPAMTQREIVKNLERILADSKEADEDSSSVAVMTAEERPVWSATRQRLINLSINNKKTMDMIDSALFVVCLDDNVTSNTDEIAANVLHGSYEVDADGKQRGTCLNRWYDKLQLIVSQSGNAGVNFEHSAVDGHTVLRYASDVFTDTIIRFAQTISGPRVHSFIGETSSESPGNGGGAEPLTQEQVLQKVKAARRPETRPRKLVFDLDEHTEDDVGYAERRLSDMILQNETACLEFTGYGKQFIVQQSMSPDAYAQIAMLAAYYHMYGRIVNTYESVQTKHFLHGRTEAGRSASMEAARFFELWKRKGAEPSKKLDAFRAALKRHSTMTSRASKGMGCDRHLYALRQLFRKQHPGSPLPGIFADKAYEVLGTSVLSTSNCGNPSLRFFGFGPVTPQGFGIGYIIKDDGMHFMVTSKNRQTRRFTKYLNDFLEDLQDLILQVEGIPEAVHRRISIARPSSEDTGGYGFFGNLEPAPEGAASDAHPVGKVLL